MAWVPNHSISSQFFSSDDEVQTALKQIAGYGPDHNCMGEKTRTLIYVDTLDFEKKNTFS